MSNKAKIEDLQSRINSLKERLVSDEGGFAGSPYEIIEYMEDEIRELTDELENTKENDNER